MLKVTMQRGIKVREAFTPRASDADLPCVFCAWGKAGPPIAAGAICNRCRAEVVKVEDEPNRQ